jgi:predicted Zn-dependent protease
METKERPLKRETETMRKLIGPAIFALAFWAATALPQEPSRFKPGFNLFSKEQDVQFGKESAAQVRKEMPVVNDSVLSGYVSQVGKRLASAPEAQQSGFPFSFEVVADRSINAFALPGGPMFIHTGLLKAVDNESQLAGVMGHEMSHVILRHGTNQASKQNLIQLPALLGSQMAGGSMLGQLTRLGIGLGANSVMLKFSRTAESQADLMGSHLMAESGYNPIEMAHFFEKLEAEGGRQAPEFFSDHPNPGNRREAIEKEMQTLPQRNYTYQTGQFDRAKQAALRVREPKPRQAPGD